MYFTTKTLVIALAAGAVAMPADTPHGGASGALSKPKIGGNSTKLTPPPSGAKKGADKRDFLGIPPSPTSQTSSRESGLVTRREPSFRSSSSWRQERNKAATAGC
ncbi:hypothetical protein PG997_000360 [Apiospora hydei]|uniref:Uncharacterized protein n=1 Tax=Apiospora hydei TaxID=1337664 RepID=A0ABR1XAK3_9PEZI